jgi:hypothetical protein
VHDPSDRRTAQHRDQARHVGHGVGAGAAAAVPADAAQHASDGAERLAGQRVGSVDADRRVEDHPLHPLRVSPGVFDRDAGPVGDGVERDLPGAEADAQRLEVIGRVGARVERASHAEAVPAQAGGMRRAQRVAAFEARAAQQAGGAGAALVEDDEVATRGRKHAVVGRGEDHARLPWTACQAMSGGRLDRRERIRAAWMRIVPGSVPERSSGTRTLRQRASGGVGQWSLPPPRVRRSPRGRRTGAGGRRLRAAPMA